MIFIRKRYIYLPPFAAKLTNMSYASSASMCDSYERDWTVVCNKKNKKTTKLQKAPLMKLDNNDYRMTIRVLSVESREIERRSTKEMKEMKEIRSKKTKRGGVRTRMSKLLRSSGYTFITRKMIDRLIEAEKMKKMKLDEVEKEDEDEKIDEDIVEEEPSVENPSTPTESEPSYEIIGHYFDPQNLSVVSPDGVKCEDVIEKAARISEWWTRVLGYKVY